MSQCVEVCCNVLQRAAECYAFVRLQFQMCQCICPRLCVLQCGAVCCSVLQCVAVCCSVLQCATECCSVLHFREAPIPDVSVYVPVCVYAAECFSVLQCVAV